MGKIVIVNEVYEENKSSFVSMPGVRKGTVNKKHS